jgi:hypothetical protein
VFRSGGRRRALEVPLGCLQRLFPHSWRPSACSLVVVWVPCQRRSLEVLAPQQRVTVTKRKRPLSARATLTASSGEFLVSQCIQLSTSAPFGAILRI